MRAEPQLNAAFIHTTPLTLRAISESYLLRLVEQWLESLRVGTRRAWPLSAEEAIETCVIPAVLGGIVRATGPRWRRTG